MMKVCKDGEGKTNEKNVQRRLNDDDIPAVDFGNVVITFDGPHFWQKGL